MTDLDKIRSEVDAAREVWRCPDCEQLIGEGEQHYSDCRYAALLSAIDAYEARHQEWSKGLEIVIAFFAERAPDASQELRRILKGLDTGSELPPPGALS